MEINNKSKIWAIVLVTVMATSAFVGISATASGTTDGNDLNSSMRMVDISESVHNGQLSNDNGKGPIPYSPPPQNGIMESWADNFDSDTVGQWPSVPPWNYGYTGAGQAVTFATDDFENDVVGNNPDSPPWTTSDGASPILYWAEDFNGYTIGEDLAGGVITGDYGYFSNFVGGGTLTAQTPPAGAPPGTIIPGFTTGPMCADFLDPVGGSYWGPVGIGDGAYPGTTTTGYIGGWVYMNALARLDLMCYDLAAGGTAIEVAFQNDGTIRHWPGGAYTQIAGVTYTVGTWHEVFINYWETNLTYRVFYDGVQRTGGVAWIAGVTNIDSMLWFGAVGVDASVDNFFHMQAPSGTANAVSVSNAFFHSGTKSVYIDQNAVVAPNIAMTTALFSTPMAGTGSCDYWLRTTTVANTNGALAQILDQNNSGVIEIRANANNFQYNNGGVWTNALVGFAATTWYHFIINFDSVAKTYTLTIGATPYPVATFARQSGTLTGVRFSGTTATQSEQYIDDVTASCAGAGANITVSNLASHSAPNSLRFQEYNSADYGYIGADGFGIRAGAVGNFSFWFRNTENRGGQQWALQDVANGFNLTLIALGINLATLEANPGVVQFVNNDGAGLWVVDGPTYNANEWHQITIEYNCEALGASGTGSYYYRWDGGALQGPYGMIDPALSFGMFACYGGAPDTFGDFFYDDFSMQTSARPGAPTNCWAKIPAPTGSEVYLNLTTDLDNPLEGIVTGTEANTHGAGTENIQEFAINDVPTWVNNTVIQDNPVQGTMTNTYANIDEIFPPDTLTETITEVIGTGGQTIITSLTDLDVPWNGTVTGTQVATHTIDGGTQDIQEIINGGNIWANYSTDLDIPNHGVVTGTHVLTHVLDGSSQQIQEMNAPFLSPGPGPKPGAQVYYTVRATFNTDCGTILPMETFEDSTIGAGAIAGISAPLDTTTDNAYFNPGDILPGIRFQDNPGPSAGDGLVAIGAGWGGAPTKTVANNYFVESLDMIFYNNDVYAVGMDLQSYFAACTPTISIYTTGDVLLATTTAPASPAGIFWGVISDEVIYRINILDAANTDGADNIAFGEPQLGNSLEHRWRTDSMLPNATALSLIVNARTNTGSDDSFTFEYSADQTLWNSTGITVNTDVMTQYTGSALMLNQSGAPLYFRVKDNNSDDWVLNDTIYIDYIRIQYWNDRPYWHTFEHVWRMENIAAGADNITLFVTARTNIGCDDPFTFSYATAVGGPYTRTTLAVNSSVMTTYSVEIPASLSGQIYIKVVDDNEYDPLQMDTIFIDQIRIERQVGMSLEHRWLTNAISMNTLLLELYVTARTNTGSDDTFTFGYSSVLAGPYTPVITVNSDVMTTYNVYIPVMVGQIYLNVIDDVTWDPVLQDSIIIDTIRLEATISGATVSTQVATADNPDHGTVTGTFVLTTSIPPDGSAQQITEIALSKKSTSNPTPQYTPSVVSQSNLIQSSKTRAPSNSLTSFSSSENVKTQFSKLSTGASAAPLSPGPQPTPEATVITEDFADAWIPSTDADIYSTPPGPPPWDVDGICTGNNGPGLTHFWSQFDTAVIPFAIANSTPTAAGLWWSAGEPAQDEWLIMPTLDLSAFMNAKLYFNSAYTMPSYGADAGARNLIKVSTNGGASWTILGDLAHDPQFEIPGAVGGPAGAGWCWYEMYLPGAVAMPFDLSAYDFMPSVTIAFHFDVPNTAVAYGVWVVDDVHIEAEAAGNSLAHAWRMQPQPVGSTTRTLFVTARTDVATNEGFTFGWSQTLAGPYTPLISIDSDTFVTKSAPLPTGFSGDLYINVIDNTGADFLPANLSSVFVDCLRVFNDNTIWPEYSADHRWRTQAIPIGAQTLTFQATARTNTGADDSFTFGYSTAMGGPYITLANTTVATDVMTTYSCPLPYTLTGPLYFNVLDNNSDWGHFSAYQIDTIYIDDIRVSYFTPGGTLVEEYVIGDRPGHGNVTGTYAMTLSNPPDLVEQQITEVNLTIYLPNLPAGASGPSPFGPGPGPEPTAQVYYTTRAAFNGDGGSDLPIEDFEDGNIGAGAIAGMDAPLDEFTNNAYFSTGDILPGIRIQDNPGPSAGDGLVILGNGFMGNPTKTVCSNYFVETTDYIFADPAHPVFAFGLDLQSYAAGLTLTITIYGIGDVLMATTTAPASNPGTFWGVISDEQIYRINLADPAGGAVEGGDNIAFGEAKEKAFSLAHAWEMDLQPNMLTRTLHMNAHTNAGANDNFSIGYVTNLADITKKMPCAIPLFNVTSSTPTTYTAPIPVSFNDEFYIVAWDSNPKDVGATTNADTLFVDMIYVQSFKSNSSTSVDIHWDLSYDDYINTWSTNYTANQDNPYEGTVTNTYTNTDEVSPPDGLTENVQEIAIGVGAPTWKNLFEERFRGTEDGDWRGDDFGGTTDVTCSDEWWEVAEVAGDLTDIMVGSYNTPPSAPRDLEMRDCEAAWDTQYASARYNMGNNWFDLTPYTAGFVNISKSGVAFGAGEGWRLEWTVNGGGVWTVAFSELAAAAIHGWNTTNWAIPAAAFTSTQFSFRFSVFCNAETDIAYFDDITMDVVGMSNGDLYTNYYTDLDIPRNATVTGTEAATHGAGNQSIAEVVGLGNVVNVNTNLFGTYPGTNWAELDPTANWAGSATATAGGVAPEARFSWTPSSVNTWRLYGGPFNCAAYQALSFGFMHFYDDFGAGCTMSVQTATAAAGPWHDTGWSIASGGGNVGPQWVNIPITNGDQTSATFYVGFAVIGNSYQIDYWYQDTAMLNGTQPGQVLEHRWRTQSIQSGATALTLFVEAKRSDSAAETFTFLYSTDNVNFTTTTIVINSPGMLTYSYALPPALSGAIYLRVDDDTSGDAPPADNVYIDNIRIERYFDVIPQYSLDHRWRMQVTDPLAQSLTLQVTARTSAGADDTFSFGYSTALGGPYTTLITVNSAIMTTYSRTIPWSRWTPATVLYLRVIDDNTVDFATADTIYVDTLTIAYSGYISGPGENDVVAYNVYRADQEHGDTIWGPYEFIGSTPCYTRVYVDAGEGLDLINQAWYYVESEDLSGQTNRSGYLSKLNYVPVTSDVKANGITPRLIVSPGLRTITITATAYDDSSQFEAIPKMDYAEMYVDVDPGLGLGAPLQPTDLLWNNVTETITGPLTYTFVPGTYEVYVRTAETINGTVFYGAVSNVTIQCIDQPPIANANVDQTVPQHTTVMFDGSLSTDDVGITGYWWNFTDGGPQSVSGQYANYTFNNEGSYIVTLEIRDTIGQGDTDTMTVNVTDGDAPIANAGPDQNKLRGFLTTFDGTGSFDPGHDIPPDRGIVNWTWTFTDGTPQTLWGSAPTYTFWVPGVYTVTLVVTDAAAWTGTDTVNINVQNYFNIDITQAVGTEGWVLVSFPNKVVGDPLTILVDALNEGAGLVQWDIIQRYESNPAAPLPGWLTTATFKPSVLNTFTYVDNTMSFWIHITSYGDGNLTVVGDLPITGEVYNIQLYTGWNLVGYPCVTPQDVMTLIGGMLFNVIQTEVYDQVDPYRTRWQDAWDAFFFLSPGQGIWIEVSADEIWTITCP